MSRLRVGLIGCGRVVERFHLPALLTSSAWTVAAASDVNPDRRRWFEIKMGGVPVFERAEDMLDHVNLDAALIASTPECQADLAMKALAHGLHALVEKPAGTSSGEARAMAEAADLAGKRLWVGFNRRFMSNYRALAGVISTLPPNSSVLGRFELSFDPREWDSVAGRMAVGPFGHGVLLDVASHQVDALGWLTGRNVRSLHVLDWSRATGWEELQYSAELAVGWSFECIARHGRGYRERIVLEWDSGRAILFPTGIHFSGNLLRPFHEAVVRGEHWAQRKLIRLGLSHDVLARSFFLQWQALARSIGGAEATDAGTSEDILRVHAGLEAIRESWEERGRVGRETL